ncbi:uncharacterized protein MYCGRDRAFT_92872 [Zymoseptoria tritici IPO323]|uniref:Uncharacterized protein n=1 Tax=Zymoseptoria tritici (strain CBS 115943 / IPO323) TaxID=336722 RepID=F9X970_ZYMTI|nr:uncharacterized protein MYCGRDRAFT_92872 [Zymoseptoria tritici IPO323]EGP88201.1 hypothetical protein MYCGRDRAFT_92872 [Zymoseptoria tritici IPO323]
MTAISRKRECEYGVGDESAVSAKHSRLDLTKLTPAMLEQPRLTLAKNQRIIREMQKDADQKRRNMVARPPSSEHDFNFMSVSAIGPFLEDLHATNAYLQSIIEAEVPDDGSISLNEETGIKRASFLGLPQELRDRIYAMAMPWGNIHVQHHGGSYSGGSNSAPSYNPGAGFTRHLCRCEGTSTDDETETKKWIDDEADCWYSDYESRHSDCWYCSDRDGGAAVPRWPFAPLEEKHFHCETPSMIHMLIADKIISSELDAAPPLCPEPSDRMANLMDIPDAVRRRIFAHLWQDSRSIALCDPAQLEAERYEDMRRFPESPTTNYPPADKNSARPTTNTAAKSRLDGATPPPYIAIPSIKFRTKAFIARHANDDEDEDGDEAQAPRYRLVTRNHFTLDLLRVNRCLHDAASSYFYATTTFVLDSDAIASMRFLSSLPDHARKCIQSVTLTGNTLMTDDGSNRISWSGNPTRPHYKDDRRLELVAPFTAFLASHLSSLREVSSYVPCGGAEDWYPPLAPEELLKLLKYGRIDKLNFVFMGEDTVETLEGERRSSRDIYSALMGPWAEKIVGPISWSWGERDLDMGSDGTTQAVSSECRISVRHPETLPPATDGVCVFIVCTLSNVQCGQSYSDR